MIITEDRLTILDQITDRKHLVGEMTVNRGRVWRIPKKLITTYLAVSETFEKTATDGEDEPDEETFTLEAGTQQVKVPHIIVYDNAGNEVNEDNYTVDYGSNEITLSADLDNEEYKVEYLPFKGSFEYHARAPKRISTEKSVLVFKNDLSVTHSVDQDDEGSRFKPHRRIYLDQFFRFELFVNTPVKVDFESVLTQISIFYNQGNRNEFKNMFYERFPEFEHYDLHEAILERWDNL